VGLAVLGSGGKGGENCIAYFAAFGETLLGSAIQFSQSEKTMSVYLIKARKQ
jgi:hypothetical protein